MMYLSQLKNNLENLVCILRVDFNIKAGQEKNSFKIKAILPTVIFLLRKKAKILLISHLGHPNGKKNKSLSAGRLIPFLTKTFKKKVIFLENFDFKKIKQRVACAPPASIFLMENIRFIAGEENNSDIVAQKIAKLGNFYVNDGFAVSHRKNASIAAIAKYIPFYAGLLMEKEINNLNRVLKKPKYPLVFILGGAKIADKIDLLNFFAQKADYILTGGGIANTLIAANGLPIGESINEPRMFPSVKKLLKNRKVKIPVDFKIAGKKLLDIGPRTIKIYSEIIKRAGTIIWNGPLGFTENKHFENGTKKIALSIAANKKAFSVAGGGETSSFLIKIGLDKKIGFVSTGGGAMIQYLSGEKLPGLIALNSAAKKNK